MKAIYTNYLFPYFVALCGAFLFWIGSILVFDGLIPYLAFMFLGAWTVFGIPFLIYRDLRRAKKFMAGKPATSEVIGELAKKFGMPEMLAEVLVQRLEQSLKQSQPTKLENHG